MRLVKVQVTEFQSIRDSTEFKVGPVTCLVGKNEAGKTALLKALYRLHPINEADESYNAAHDYPRWSFVAYEGEVEKGVRKPATVAQATYELEPDDVAPIKDIFGASCFADHPPSVTLRKGYSNQLEVSNFDVNCEAALKHLVKAVNLPQQIANELAPQEASAVLKNLFKVRCCTN